MTLIPFRQIPGRRVVVSTLAGLLGLTLGACKYGFQTGGGFPSDIRTLYIRPFENNTAQFELDQQLFSKLNEQLPRALGVRVAGEEVADAWVTGKITRYDDVAQNYRPGSSTTRVEVLQHEVQITIEIRLVNRRNNTILWDSQSLTGRGQYDPARQSDVAARELALKNLLQQIVDGAQSQW
jgi:lipopolysaccharide assembly LptE-like protein